tara:strand:- start:47758 stop:48132 length:375 start_codon:yes stop_codon:yes gene_type:complete
MKTIKNNLIYYFPIYIYIIFLFYVSTSAVITLEPQISKELIPNYIKHIILYFILNILLLRAFTFSKDKNPYLISILISTLYGIFLETYQIFIPGRFFDFLDILSNTFGIILASIIYKLKYKIIT